MTISFVQIGALLLGFLAFIMYWISPDAIDQIKWLLWMTMMTVVICSENIIIHMIDPEEFEDDDSDPV